RLDRRAGAAAGLAVEGKSCGRWIAPRPVGVEAKDDAPAGRNVGVVRGVPDRHTLTRLCINPVPQLVDGLGGCREHKSYRPPVYSRAAVGYSHLALETHIPLSGLPVANITGRA